MKHLTKSKFNLTVQPIERDLGFLRKPKIIERVGAKKNGGYKLIGKSGQSMD